MTPHLSSFPTDAADAIPASDSLFGQCGVSCSPKPQLDVGQRTTSTRHEGADSDRPLTAEAIRALDDAGLDAYINRCAEGLYAAHERHKCTGAMDDAEDMHEWWEAEVDALTERGSRPHVVARMEAERGLA